MRGKKILQIWVTWASKITLKNFQLCSIKIKGSHAPCDVTCNRSISDYPLLHVAACLFVPRMQLSYLQVLYLLLDLLIPSSSQQRSHIEAAVASELEGAANFSI